MTASRPTNGDVGVPVNSYISADVRLPTPGADIDPTTLTSSSVVLFRASDKLPITLTLNTSPGGDQIIATPASLLDPNTTYTFQVTSGLKDTSGTTFQPYTISFTTGTSGGTTDPSSAFEKVTLPTTGGEHYTVVTVGPDGDLYAGTTQGLIQRFTINSDGTLGAAQNITTLTAFEGGPQLISGMAFDPASTPSNLILWVANGDAATARASDWTGKITKLTGANLQTAQDAVINLPRTTTSPSTNQLAFGPDGALVFAQGSMSDMGSPDDAWGQRTEHLLSSAILRLDTTKVGSSAIDVKTDSGGTYNPFASGAPLTIYATGVRAGPIWSGPVTESCTCRQMVRHRAATRRLHLPRRIHSARISASISLRTAPIPVPMSRRNPACSRRRRTFCSISPPADTTVSPIRCAVNLSSAAAT